MRLPVSVRARTTLLATLVVVLALLAGAAGLLLTLRHELVQQGDEAARTRARDLAELLAADGLPRVLATPREDDIVQVIDPAGRIVAAGPGNPGRPLGTFAPATAGAPPIVRTVRDVPDPPDPGEPADAPDAGDYRVWAMAARDGSGRGPYTIYVATSLETADETVGTVAGLLGAGLPVLTGALALAAWILLGRALRPVEAIRAEVADISERALDRRVPVPPTADEIGRLAATMNAMLDRLQAASDRQRTFVADASHELQSPLTSLRTQLEIALARSGGTKWPVTAADLLAETQRMERLVRDLLFLARVDARPDPGTDAGGEPVDLDDIALDEAARLRPGTRVRIDTSRVSAAPVTGRRDELTRLVRNLLENAVRHAQSAVTLEVTCRAETAELAVEDDGPGVPPDQRGRIFDRFARIDRARARGGGTGLGLAIAADIAARHGGTIAVEGRAPAAEHQRPTAADRDLDDLARSAAGGTPRTPRDEPVGARFVLRLPQLR